MGTKRSPGDGMGYKGWGVAQGEPGPPCPHPGPGSTFWATWANWEPQGGSPGRAKAAAAAAPRHLCERRDGGRDPPGDGGDGGGGPCVRLSVCPSCPSPTVTPPSGPGAEAAPGAEVSAALGWGGVGFCQDPPGGLRDPPLEPARTPLWILSLPSPGAPPSPLSPLFPRREGSPNPSWPCLPPLPVPPAIGEPLGDFGGFLGVQRCLSCPPRVRPVAALQPRWQRRCHQIVTITKARLGGPHKYWGLLWGVPQAPQAPG